MYRSFIVSNFRCFHRLSIADLKRVNLISGINNVGKTALLEALFLHCGAYNPALVLKLSAFRGIEAIKLEIGRGAETPWESLFTKFDVSKKVTLEGENDVAGRRILHLKVIREAEELSKIGQPLQHAPEPSQLAITSSELVQVLELEYEHGDRKRGSYYVILDQKGLRSEPIPPSPPFPGFFLASRARLSPAEDAERFGKLEIIGQQDVLVRALKEIEPQLQRLAVVVAGGIPMIHGEIGLGRLVPLPVMGDGMARLASLVVAIANAQGGVVLVDEIENGLHHSVLQKVWRAIGDISRQFDAQVFATTHSWECIVAAHRAFTGSDVYDFRLHRLERAKEKINAITYDQEALTAAVDAGLEVR